MNERIKKFAEQARLLTGWPVGEIEYQKFAILIIKKCRDIVSDTRDMAIEEEWNVDEAMSTAMYDIEEYFGVEK
jgi:hypothetical protein